MSYATCAEDKVAGVNRRGGDGLAEHVPTVPSVDLLDFRYSDETSKLRYNKDDWLITDEPVYDLPDGSSAYATPYAFDAPVFFCIEPADKKAIEDPMFVKFNDFPKEVRVKIWKLALPRPRVATLESPTYDLSTKTLQFMNLWGLECGDLSVYPLLTTCFESREVFLQTYSLLQTQAASNYIFWNGSCCQRVSQYLPEPRPLGYFDLEEDILVVHPYTSLVLESCGYSLDTSRIRHLGVHRRSTDCNDDLRIRKLASQFPSLNTLTILDGLQDRHPHSADTRLTPHILDIDWLSNSIPFCHSSKKYLPYRVHAWQKVGNARLQKFLDSTACHDKFWDNVKVTTGTIGYTPERQYGNLLPHGRRRHFIKPKVPKYHGVVFQTIEYLRDKDAKKDDRWEIMTIPELDCDFLCTFEGKLI